MALRCSAAQLPFDGRLQRFVFGRVEPVVVVFQQLQRSISI